jgi:hypothetical protein
MSQWGNLDRKVLSGTATANVGNVFVIGSSTTFNTNAQVGFGLLIQNVSYRIETIVSDVVLKLDTPYVYPGSGANTGLTVAVQQSPKNLLSSGLAGANLTNKQNVFGVDRLEAANTLVKAKGISHTGWVKHTTYTGAQGTRNKAEVLVAMSKNFNSNASVNPNATVNLQVDANDDTTIPE